MSETIYYERFNQEKLENVLKCSNYPVKKPTDNSTWYKMSKTDILKYSQNTTNGVKEVQYSRSKMPHWGRLISSGAIQHLPKDIRSYIAGEYYTDIDQNNSHFRIIKWLFKKYDIRDDFLDNYLENRTETLKVNGLLNKNSACCLINNETISKKASGNLRSFHDKLYNEDYGLIAKMEKDYKKSKNDLIKRIQKIIIKKLNDDGKPHFNLRGKLFSRLISGYEDLILKYQREFCELNELKVGVLMYDGLMVENNPKMDDEFLQEMELYCFEKTGIEVKIQYKSTETDWYPIPMEDTETDTPEEPTESLVPIEPFSHKTARRFIEKAWTFNKQGKHIGIDNDLLGPFMDYMNLYFCHISLPISYGYRQTINEPYKLVRDADIEHITLSTAPASITHPVSYKWRKHEDVLLYDKVDFYVNYSKNDVIKEYDEETGIIKPVRILNVYTRPFYKYSATVEEDCKDFFNFLYEIISNSNGDFYKLVLDLIAYILQFGKSGIALILMGEMGIGKGTLKNALFIILTKAYCYTDECGARIGSRFNSHEEGKLLGVMEELQNNHGEQHFKREIMKNKVTDKDTIIERKGIDAYTATNNCNYIYMTNGQNPQKIERDERRYVAMRVNPKMKGQKNYFIHILDVVRKNKAALRDYFQNRPVTTSDMKVINTEANKNLLWLNSSNMDRFIEEKLDNYMKCDKIRSGELYTNFQYYCQEDENRDKRAIPSHSYFIDKILSSTKYLKVKDDEARVWLVNPEYIETL